MECCFVDDVDDVKLYDCKKMANAITEGILNKTIVEKKETVPANEKTETKQNTTATTTPKSNAIKNTYTKPTRILKKGSKGNDVKWLQFELKQLGYSLAIDGVFGTITEKYVKEFQRKKKITVDGIVEKVTLCKFKFEV